MPNPDFDPARYLEAAAPLLQLPLVPEYKPGIVANLERLHELAQLLLDFPLPDTCEPLPEFEP